MSRIDVIRAWKDEAYRQSLSEAERTCVPENPAGACELTAAEAAAVVGGVVLAASDCCVHSCHSPAAILAK